MTREQKIEKLKKIKALAERGIGGEKETAMRMYEELKTKYEIADDETNMTTTHWFRYKDALEEKLLCQIFYKVTGDTTGYAYAGRRANTKKRGCDCTEAEALEITLLFSFYKEELKKELNVFIVAFYNANSLFPDDNVRCHANSNREELTREEKRFLKKAAVMSSFFDKNQPPRAMLQGGANK